MPLPSCGEAHVFLLLPCSLWKKINNNGWAFFLFFLLLSYGFFFGALLQSTVDKLIKKTNLALVVGTNSWRDQFMEAITVSAGTVTEAACCRLEQDIGKKIKLTKTFLV